ncbi:SIR2 family protein [Nitrosovibrio sp. Nv17]|uniref:SIR2 family protein n=1 Tax=Nitrosovibrio sp. Nv17 TaxID=1855339 RepID=UPI0035181349
MASKASLSLGRTTNIRPTLRKYSATTASGRMPTFKRFSQRTAYRCPSETGRSGRSTPWARHAPVFTTNFDTVLEKAVAEVSGRPLAAFHIEGSYAANDVLSNEQYPIYCKLHGDFRYQSVKNLSADLKAQDDELGKCLVAPGTGAVPRHTGNVQRHLEPAPCDGGNQQKRPGNRAGESRARR